MEPWRHATFVLAFLLNVAFGGWAIWIELMAIHLSQPSHDTVSLQAALATFFPAVTGVTVVQTVLETRTDSRIVLFSVAWLLLILVTAIYLAFVPASATGARTAVLWLLSAAAMWFWVVANCDSPMYQDKFDSATGGDPTAPLSGAPDASED